ncbi:alcohol dehydrogenase [Niastella yeongjuensis]|uniref:Alcohol dehydrogenase n=1 Tax=Niastella yeongjuensis TaxID=354355 RepID=A0A1V9EWY4_9BACT|nr:aldo/keto reductase [Niastella yeongjuensis]OQP50639.1 alcohol dehydrogenase [Niastella yeongjuensis]SEN24906.1 voltage-dependent potassium channel beta subunit, animal [Niastella yeongjuensis]
MEYRRLGRSGVQLSVLSFGSWVTFHKQIEDNSADTLMGIAYDAGINFFDNAEGYAGGESEKMMGRVLKNKNWDRTSYTLSSKVFFGLHGKNNKPNQAGLSRKHIVEACHGALERLQQNYLDLYFCHRPDPTVPIEEVVWTMHNLVQQGKVLYWGTSMWSGAEIMEAHRVAQQYCLIGPVMEQPQYNMFERHKMEMDYLPVFQNVGLGTTIWSPLAAGFLTGKYNDGIPEDSRLAIQGFGWLQDRWLQDEKIKKVKQLATLAKQLNVSLASLAIAWTIKNPNVTTAILGATKPEQLHENLKALDALKVLTPDVQEQIENILQNKPAMDLA